IAQVEGLAHAVVARPVERNARRLETAQRIGQRRARRVEDGDVEEPGGPGRRRPAAAALPGVEADVMVVATGREERGVGSVALRELEAQHAAVEGEGPLEVRDLQVNMTDAGSGIDRPEALWVAHDGPPASAPAGSPTPRR